MKGVKDTKCACRISELRLVLARISIVVVDNIVKSYIHKLEFKKIQFSIINIQVSRCIGRQNAHTHGSRPAVIYKGLG